MNRIYHSVKITAPSEDFYIDWIPGVPVQCRDTGGVVILIDPVGHIELDDRIEATLDG